MSDEETLLSDIAEERQSDARDAKDPEYKMGNSVLGVWIVFFAGVCIISGIIMAIYTGVGSDPRFPIYETLPEKKPLNGKWGLDVSVVGQSDAYPGIMGSVALITIGVLMILTSFNWGHLIYHQEMNALGDKKYHGTIWSRFDGWDSMLANLRVHNISPERYRWRCISFPLMAIATLGYLGQGQLWVIILGYGVAFAYIWLAAILEKRSRNVLRSQEAINSDAGARLLRWNLFPWTEPEIALVHLMIGAILLSAVIYAAVEIFDIEALSSSVSAFVVFLIYTIGELSLQWITRWYVWRRFEFTRLTLGNAMFMQFFYVAWIGVLVNLYWWLPLALAHGKHIYPSK